MKRASDIHGIAPALARPRSRAAVAVLAAFILALAVRLAFAPPASAAGQEPPPLLQSSLDAADALHFMLARRLASGSPILVANLADLEDLSRTSPMGRLISQQIASRLSERGYVVLEARLRGSMKIEIKDGEFLLSRDTSHLRPSYAAQAALVGAYSRGSDRWYISVRVLRLSDSAILAAHEYALPRAGVDLRSNGIFGRNDALDEAPGEWARYAPRPLASSGGVKAAWSDPAGYQQLKPLVPIRKK